MIPGHLYRLQSQRPRRFRSSLPSSYRQMISRYRHAAPSGPWPWMDFRNIDDSTTTNDVEIDQSWPGYPQNLFGNWTPDQVGRSQMLTKCSKNQSSTIYWMDVLSSGKFVTSNISGGHISKVTTSNQEDFWDMMKGEVGLIYPCLLVWV